jgi:hypothetical protein
MSLALFALAIILVLGLAGVFFHKSNLDATYRKVIELSAASYSKNNQESRGDMKTDLINFLYTPQGSTFNALAISAWLLLIVGVFFSFLLTPQISEGVTFLKVPSLTSSSMGFLSFGIIALMVGGIIVVVLKLPNVYSMYIISRKVKGAIMITWLILIIPVLIPVYLATIYPYPEGVSNWIDIAFISLVISQILLLSPIFIRSLGVKL